MGGRIPDKTIQVSAKRSDLRDRHLFDFVKDKRLATVVVPGIEDLVKRCPLGGSSVLQELSREKRRSGVAGVRVGASPTLAQDEAGTFGRERKRVMVKKLGVVGCSLALAVGCAGVSESEDIKTKNQWR